jgi:hypothetical protein
MAIGSIGFAPASASTQSSKSNSPIQVDENGRVTSSDPELQLQQRIIDEMFGVKNSETSSTTQDASPSEKATPDVVQLSSESIELYQKDKVVVEVKDPNQQVKVTVEHEERLKVEKTETQAQPAQQSDPLIMDLNGNGIELTDVRRGGGVQFDITGDGKKETVSWVKPNDGLLVLDKNNNGVIDNGTELFGDQNGAVNGFAELAKYDANGDGTINKSDPIFSKLSIWQDRNQNGISEKDELSGLEARGIQSISLNPDQTKSVIAGNLVTGYSAYQSTSGQGKIGEAYLNYKA